MRHPPFEPGNNFGRGRIRGSKNKLASTVYADCLAVWERDVRDDSPAQTKGQAALLNMAKWHPRDLVKAVFGILPQDFAVEHVLADYRTEELEAMIQRLHKEIAAEERPPLVIEHQKAPDNVKR
jgi:hypothetical protein